MNENLESQLERRFRPLKPATHPGMSTPSTQARSVRRYVVSRCSPHTTAMCFALRMALITLFQ